MTSFVELAAPRALAALLFGLAFLVMPAALAPAMADERTSVDRSYEADRLVVDRFVGTLTVETREGDGPFTLSLNGQRAHLERIHLGVRDGALIIRWEGDADDGSRPWWQFWGGTSTVSLNDIGQYPTLTVSMPRSAPLEVTRLIGHFEIGDLDAPLVFSATHARGEIGDTQSARVSVAGSGRIRMGAVAEELSVSIAGSGNVHAASASTLDAKIAGSGDVHVGHIHDGLKADIAGSGNVVVDETAGAFNASIAGSGSVRVAGGTASSFRARIAGSGGVRFNGTASNPDVNIMGSGNVHLAAIDGALSTRSAGSGRVRIGE
jgi:hypothetical protein